jgi:Cullin family
MQQPPDSHSDQSRPSASATSQGKRKSIHLQNAPKETGHHRQSTISELLNNSKPTNGTALETGVSPSNKRHKSKEQSNVTPVKCKTANMAATQKKWNPYDRPIMDLTKDDNEVGLSGARTNTSPGQPRVTLRQPPVFKPHTGSKTIVVRNLKQRDESHNVAYFEKSWTRLDKAMTAVFRRSKIAFPLEELYRSVENMCNRDTSAELFSRLRKRMHTYVEEDMKARLLHNEAKPESAVVQDVVAEWKIWQGQLVGAH